MLNYLEKINEKRVLIVTTNLSISSNSYESSYSDLYTPFAANISLLIYNLDRQNKLQYAKKLKERVEEENDKIILDFTLSKFIKEEEERLKKEVENFLVYHTLEQIIEKNLKSEIFEVRDNKESSLIIFSEIFPVLYDEENGEIFYLKLLNKKIKPNEEIFIRIMQSISYKHNFDSLMENREKIKERYINRRYIYEFNDFSERNLSYNKQKSYKNTEILKNLIEKYLPSSEDLRLCTTSFSWKNCLKLGR